MSAQLLREPAGDGFPTDYVLARVRGRRAVLSSEWRAAMARGHPGPTSDAAIWEGLLAELGWLRTQLNPKLRETLAPVFGLFELKTLVLALRGVIARRGAEVLRLLAESQLAEPLRRAFLGEPDAPAAVAAVAHALGPVSGDQVSLQRAYAEAGLKGFETRLTRQYLETVAASRLHPAVRAFFEAFIDVRNLMTLYKHLRWQVTDTSAFLPGGTVEVSRIRRTSEGKDTTALDALVREIVGRAAPPLAMSESALESILLARLSARLRRLSTESEDVGLLLDYAWRVYVHARNRALLLHSQGVDAAVLEKELVA
ncbi:MAG: V-type ATPase subunit [Gammaproteobacteria bacterium]|nr:V-type ATPase subunit [Gammaproteobacteria bacterium]